MRSNSAYEQMEMLPSYSGSEPYRPQRRTWMRRPRTLLVFVACGIFALLLIPADNRQTAKNILSTNLGVNIPDKIPDRLQDFFDYAGVADTDGTTDLEDFTPDSVDIDGKMGQNPTKDSGGMGDGGHMIVENTDEHPILTLIHRAEAEWNAKIKRQSKTLKDAAAEYRRRYGRNPPKGFDKWWEYAKANKIVLVDEYDQIFKDLQPFYALDPNDLRHRINVMQEREETFTIRVQDGELSQHGEYASLARAGDLSDLMSRVVAHLPNLNMTFTRHDQPACQLSFALKEHLLDQVEQGEYYSPSDYIIESDLALSNWARGCHPHSPLREIETAGLEANPATDYKERINRPSYETENSKKRSFIYDHSAAMDICQHPEIMSYHGFTMASGTDAGPLVPLFTFAKTNIHADILATPLEQYSPTYIGFDPDWDKKPYNKLMWRGSTTGVDFITGNDWRNSQRSRLHFVTNEKEGEKEVLLEVNGKAKKEKIDVGKMNSMFMDCSFSGKPAQCDPETCKIMTDVIDFKPTMGLDESYQYKYVFDVDGNGWSGRFHRLMSMKAAVLKSTLFPEWYADRIQPWVHYIPIKVDYSDLYDVMTFFAGTPGGNKGHDGLGKKIGTAGKDWAANHWRPQDMASYMFRLSLEWSRLAHRGNGNLDYVDF